MQFQTYFYDTNKSRNFIKMINNQIKSYCIKVGNLLVPVDYYDSQLKGKINLKLNSKTELISTIENTNNQILVLIKNIPTHIVYNTLIENREPDSKIIIILMALNKKSSTYDFLYLKGE